jgi:hypothetical protein
MEVGEGGGGGGRGEEGGRDDAKKVRGAPHSYVSIHTHNGITWLPALFNVQGTAKHSHTLVLCMGCTVKKTLGESFHEY